MAVNQGPSLRRVAVASEPKQRAGDKQVELQTRKGKSAERAKTKSEARDKKRKSEAVRRDAERCQLERMCLLFRAPRNGWTRKEVLSLGKITFLTDGRDESLTSLIPAVLFRIYGSEAFQPGLIEVHPTAPGL